MSLARGPAKILTGDIFAQTAMQVSPLEDSAGVPADRTRPILKIQDGCNNRCSYCVIPFVRGRSRSLPPNEVLEETRKLVAAGAKEIVLSGINLGSYGRDLSPRVELADLVRRILDETALEQLRFSSIEPQDVTEDFVALVAASPRIAPHFHVPLQSGSDRILRAMHRWYRAAHYAERIQLIRSALPDAAIGADVIVGFPGETDEDFNATFDFITRLPFTYLHVFSFSARPGTKAADLGAPVSAGGYARPCPRVACARPAESRGVPRASGRTYGACAHAGARRRHLDRSFDGKLLESAGARVGVPRIIWCEARISSAPEAAERVKQYSVLEDNLGERQVPAVRNRERNIFHAQPLGDLSCHSVQTQRWFSARLRASLRYPASVRPNASLFPAPSSPPLSLRIAPRSVRILPRKLSQYATSAGVYSRSRIGAPCRVSAASMRSISAMSNPKPTITRASIPNRAGRMQILRRDAIIPILNARRDLA